AQWHPGSNLGLVLCLSCLSCTSCSEGSVPSPCLRVSVVKLRWAVPMIKFNYEYERKLRVAYLGCGGHSFRNIFPCFQFAPVDLVAVCDLQEARAAAFARQFGARRHYTDYARMLAEERPEAVFIVTGYDAAGRPTYPPLAEQAPR